MIRPVKTFLTCPVKSHNDIKTGRPGDEIRPAVAHNLPIRPNAGVYIELMTGMIFACALLALFTTAAAVLRMLAAGEVFTYATLGRGIFFQSLGAGLLLWLSSLIAPLDTMSVSSTAIFILVKETRQFFKKQG